MLKVGFSVKWQLDGMFHACLFVWEKTIASDPVCKQLVFAPQHMVGESFPVCQQQIHKEMNSSIPCDDSEN